MSEVTIKIKDKPDSEEVDISMEFNPPLKDDSSDSVAQNMGGAFIVWLKEQYED